MLYRVIFNEHSIWRVSEEFKVSRGFVQSLLQASAVFASSLVSFCEELKQEFWALGILLPAFTKRLAFGVRAELVALVRLRTSSRIASNRLKHSMSVSQNRRFPRSC